MAPLLEGLTKKRTAEFPKRWLNKVPSNNPGVVAVSVSVYDTKITFFCLLVSGWLWQHSKSMIILSIHKYKRTLGLAPLVSVNPRFSR